MTLALLANVRVQGQKLEQVSTAGVDNVEHSRWEHACGDGIRRGCKPLSSSLISADENSRTSNTSRLRYTIPKYHQRQDTRTLKIPVSKPMLDTKSSVVATAGNKAEEAHVQCHKLHHEHANTKGGLLSSRWCVLFAVSSLLDSFGYISLRKKVQDNAKQQLSDTASSYPY